MNRDELIRFEPQGHVYTYNGTERLLPVSSLVSYFFEPFDAQAAAERREARLGIRVEESLAQWERIGRRASEVGTFLHLQTENYFKRGFFEREYDFAYNGSTERISLENEWRHFMRFIEDYDIRPHRQEWTVYDLGLNIAGTIDMTCSEPDGQITIYDWKRSGKVVDRLGRPIVAGFAGKRSINGIELPDTAFYHYCLQQNLYRYMLEQNYGITVKGMNLVVLWPEYKSYYVVGVPRMDDVMSRIESICHERDLGHRLLKVNENE